MVALSTGEPLGRPHSWQWEPYISLSTVYLMGREEEEEGEVREGSKKKKRKMNEWVGRSQGGEECQKEEKYNEDGTGGETRKGGKGKGMLELHTVFQHVEWRELCCLFRERTFNVSLTCFSMWTPCRQYDSLNTKIDEEHMEMVSGHWPLTYFIWCVIMHVSVYCKLSNCVCLCVYLSVFPVCIAVLLCMPGCVSVRANVCLRACLFVFVCMCVRKREWCHWSWACACV